MMDVLEITDSSDHPIGQSPHAALIPSPYLAQYEMWRDAVWGTKAPIARHTGPSIVTHDERIQVLIMCIHGHPIPFHALVVSIEQSAEFHAFTPATFIFAFLTNVLWSVFLLNREEQFDRGTVE